MLGIYLLVCMAVYFALELKAWSLTRGGSKAVVLSSEPKTYQVCRQAVKLHAASKIIALVAYLGCAWPYVFIKDASIFGYMAAVVCGFAFLVLLILFSYRDLQDAIQISMDEVICRGRKSISIKVSDIYKITCPLENAFKINFKDKKKRTATFCFRTFDKKIEIDCLMRQMRDSVAIANGKEKSLAHKMNIWPLAAIISRSTKLLIVLCLIYTSYCCIDYDFIRQDYTWRYNALNVQADQTENAWPHYVQAAVNCVELEEELQKLIETQVESSPLDFTDNQKNELKSWFAKNAVSWENLKKAASIDYCNAEYNQISLMSDKGRTDFSHPSDSGYAQIRDLYGNVRAGLQAKVLDMNWFDLLQMQVVSSRHFIYGKSYLDQIAGYGLLRRSVDLMAGQDNDSQDDLDKMRALLKKQFPAGVPLLSIEGEMLILCSSFDDMINIKRIPVQSPLNPMFLLMGSRTGTEKYIRKCHSAMLEKARKGAEYQPEELSMLSVPFVRKAMFCILGNNIAKLYQNSQKANTNLLAAYFMLNLEEYRLSKGSYPADVLQLKEAGFRDELPDDIDSGGKIIYRNEGQRAVLYAVGYNAIDDGGFKDQWGSDDKRDDIVYWQRDLIEKKEK